MLIPGGSTTRSGSLQLFVVNWYIILLNDEMDFVVDSKLFPMCCFLSERFIRLFSIFQSGTEHLDLNFRAINYSADVYLNGHKTVLPKGMFRRHSLDVTDVVHPDGENLLAVLVYPPDHPGSIPPEGGQGGDHEVHLYIHKPIDDILQHFFLKD